MVYNPQDNLDVYTPHVLSERKRYIEKLGHVSVHGVLDLYSYYTDRMGRRETPAMGEYVPFLLADILDAHDYISGDLLRAWNKIYTYSILIDDFKDRHRCKRGEKMTYPFIDDLVSSLPRAITPSRFWPRFWSHSKEMIQAMQQEQIVQRMSSVQTSSPAWYAVALHHGKKAATWKSLADMILLKAHNRVLTNREEYGLDFLSAGLQLVDDITDLREDYMEGTMSYPLRRLLYQDGYLRSANSRGAKSCESAIQRVVRSGILEETYLTAEAYTRIGINGLELSRISATGSFFNQLANSCRLAAKSVSRERMGKHNNDKTHGISEPTTGSRTAPAGEPSTAILQAAN